MRKRQKRDKRTSCNEIDHQGKNISSKEIEKLDTSKNPDNITELHAEFLVPVCNSENIGNNAINLKPIETFENYLTEIVKDPPIDSEISKSMDYDKDMANVNNERLLEDAVVTFTEEGLPAQNEIINNVNLSESPPLF
ncbi:hypothetical protein WA026_008200 [Henosepilachna vigintioctopunctata]|uniref:Uncharacterized protein n=1 Tax=Henosepilachna vigintioctopunctata TaxID=420089 RepID=A0AAW1TKY0_9CUCU